MIDLMPGFGAFTPAVGGGGGSFATWNPSDKAASIVLSSGNLVATNSGGGGQCARSTLGKTTGLWYSEHTLVILGGTEHSLGIANASASLVDYGGLDTNSLVYYTDGSVYYNNVLVSTIQGTTTGQRVDQAINLTAGLAWWRTNNGNWNNSGTANPATNTGGITISVSGTKFVYTSMFYSTESNTAQFGSGSWAGSPPSGYGGWT